MNGKEPYFDLKTTRRVIVKAYAVALAIGIPYLLFVLLTGMRIPCVLYELFGVLCPGCGLTRMCTSIARLHFVDAFGYNKAFFLLSIFWNLVAVLALIGKPRLARSRKFLLLSLVLTIIFLTIFGILRNIY